MRSTVDIFQQPQISAPASAPNPQPIAHGDDNPPASYLITLMQLGVAGHQLSLFSNLTQSDLDNIIAQPDKLPEILEVLAANHSQRQSGQHHSKKIAEILQHTNTACLIDDGHADPQTGPAHPQLTHLVVPSYHNHLFSNLTQSERDNLNSKPNALLHLAKFLAIGVTDSQAEAAIKGVLVLGMDIDESPIPIPASIDTEQPVPHLETLMQMGVPDSHMHLFSHLTQFELDKIIIQTKSLRLLIKLMATDATVSQFRVAIGNLLANKVASTINRDNPPDADDGRGSSRSTTDLTPTTRQSASISSPLDTSLAPGGNLLQRMGIAAPLRAQERQIDLADMAAKTERHMQLIQMGVSAPDVVQLFSTLTPVELDKVISKPNGLQNLTQQLAAGLSVAGAKKAIRSLLIGDGDTTENVIEVTNKRDLNRRQKQEGLSGKQRRILIKPSVSAKKSPRVRKKSEKEKKTPTARNKNPIFIRPTNFTKLPPTCQALVMRIQEEKDLPVAFYDYLVVMRYEREMRLGIPDLCVAGMKAVLAGLFASMNLSTLQCHTYGEQLAKNCGLSTYQISRHLNALEYTGLIIRDMFRGPGGLFLPQQITISTKLLEVFGYSADRLARIQKQHRSYSTAKNQQPFNMARFFKRIVKKATSNLEKSLHTLKEKIQPPPIFFTKIRRDFAVAIAQKVENTLLAFKLGRYCSTFSSA